MQYNGQQCIVVMEEYRRRSVLKVQNISGVVALAEALEVNSLTSVNLKDNDIPEEGKQQLRDAVGGKSITLQL